MVRSPVQTLCAIAAGLLAAGCGQDLPDPALVVSARIAALRATPSALGDESLTELRALVVQPDPPGPVSLLWWACPLPAGADPRDCTPPGDVVVTPTAPDSARLQHLAEGGADLVVFVAACTSGEPSPSARLDAIRCQDGQQASLAFKRLAVLEAGETAPPNPVAVALESAPVPGCAAARCARQLQLTVEAAPDDAAGLLTDFLATDGELDVPRVAGPSPATLWTPSTDAPATVHFWAIVRDGRGGADWREAVLAAGE